MKGNAWLRLQEQQVPGFLEKAYAGRKFTRQNDAAVARQLQPLSSAAGANVTGRVVEEVRHELGMKVCSRRGPVCELGLSTCGPVVTTDAEGVPLCAACAKALAAPTASFQAEAIPEARHETMASDQASLPPCDHGIRWPHPCRECEASVPPAEAREWLANEEAVRAAQLPLRLTPEPSLPDLVKAEVARQLAPLQSLFPLLDAVRMAIDGGAR